MKSARVWILSMSLAAIVMTAAAGSRPRLSANRSLCPWRRGAEVPAPLERWEFTIGGRVGAPVGHLQVGEFHGGQGTVGAAPGTRLSLNTLGIHVSEAVEASVAVSFHRERRRALQRPSTISCAATARPASRWSTTARSSNPGPFTPTRTSARLDLAYERRLWRSPADDLIGSIGLAYVYFNPTLTGHGHSNSEDFYLQELPVPIAGLRWSHALGDHWLLAARRLGRRSAQGRQRAQEGGTVFLQQAQADADAGLVYRWRGGAELEIGYHFTYFFQHEKSQEDINDFELIDNGLRVRFSMRF